MIKLVNLILFEAVRQEASDIHVQPYEDRLVVRMRIDGVLFDTLEEVMWRLHEGSALMAVYVYTAIEGLAGRAEPIRGTITANSPREARNQLRERGLALQDIERHAHPAPQHRHPSHRSAPPALVDER